MNLVKIIITLLVSLFIGYQVATHVDFNTNHEFGDVIDKIDNVKVYYNGGVNHTEGRSVTSDNYNLGLKYQCAEFVKRYYYKRYKHKMPNSYGHAKDFFNPKLTHGEMNKDRGLRQFFNHDKTKPRKGDLVVFDSYLLNSYGHVAIVSKVDDEFIEIIQQNPGPFSSSRESFKLHKTDDVWHIEADHLLGWLRR
ncbi:MAG TPA: CHAP domain-containing protein [Thiotrichaceae bacterium]|nr:CHAP domain-containing protein [Thiotrichaceae bacterium]